MTLSIVIVPIPTIASITGFSTARPVIRDGPHNTCLKYNRDQYPTHAVGPIISWMDINRGDIFTEIYSTASASKGINAYFKREFGENHPNANLNYKQGDIVTSTS